MLYTALVYVVYIVYWVWLFDSLDTQANFETVVTSASLGLWPAFCSNHGNGLQVFTQTFGFFQFSLSLNICLIGIFWRTTYHHLSLCTSMFSVSFYVCHFRVQPARQQCFRFFNCLYSLTWNRDPVILCFFSVSSRVIHGRSPLFVYFWYIDAFYIAW